MDAGEIETIVKIVFISFLALFTIGIMLFTIMLLIIPTKKLQKLEMLRKFIKKPDFESYGVDDNRERSDDISEIKKITEAQNAKIEALDRQNREIVEKLDKLIEQVESWYDDGY